MFTFICSLVTRGSLFVPLGEVLKTVVADGVRRFFFFQAEDGIRDLTVTGVQTCALPILVADRQGRASGVRELVLVTAHLDSINIAGGPSANAPGADDNASGSAGLMEIDRKSVV